MAPKDSKEIVNSSTDPRSLPAGEKAPLDLFKAVFQDSSSEESDSSSDSKYYLV